MSLRQSINLKTPDRNSLEARLQSLAADRLGRERAISDSYDRLWEIEARGQGRLTVVERLRFRVLYQQFTGTSVPGLGQAVKVARLVWKKLKRGAPQA